MKFFTIIIFALFFCVTLLACNSQKTDELIAINENNKLISVNELLSSPKSFTGNTIKVSGLFFGWKGSCTGAPPITRSDWMLESDGKCIYVSGPVPQGIKRGPNSNDIGKKITIQGLIKFDSLDVPYLKAKER